MAFRLAQWMERERANRGVRLGAAAGLVLGLTSLVLAAWAYASLGSVDRLSLAEAAVLLPLSYGVHRRSRAAAILMLAYFLASRLAAMLDAGKPVGWLWMLVFGGLFAAGVRGTIDHRRLTRTSDVRKPPLEDDGPAHE
jgi:hypothetical protein